MSLKGLRERHIFLFSGLSDDVREDLASKVVQLGGVYLETQVFKPTCTHVICGKLSRGEKFLGACAMGKWILVPEYVTACAKAKQWLSEELYEWGPKWAKKGDYPEDMLSAPSTWRHHCAETKRGAFTGWKTSLLVESVKRKTVYKRLLHDGGGKVYKLPPLPTAAHDLSHILTHVFVQPDDNDALMNLLKEGFQCYSPNYIGDYLIKGPMAAFPAAQDSEVKSECYITPQGAQPTGLNETKKFGKQVTSLIIEKAETNLPGRNKHGLRKECKKQLSQRSMDQYCISSPRTSSQQSLQSLSQESYVSTPTQSKCSSPLSSEWSNSCHSPSLLCPVGTDSGSQPTSESSTTLTNGTCSDVFATPKDDEVLYLKTVYSKSGCSGTHSSAVNPRFSSLERGTTLSRLQNRKLQNLSGDRKHFCSVTDSDLCVVEREKFAIDTSDCLRSSFKDLVSTMPQRIPQRPASDISECSVKAVTGSSTFSSVSSLSEFSSRTFSSGSVCSNQSSARNQDASVKVRRSSRMAAMSSKYSSSSSDSCLPLEQIASSSEDDKMSLSKKKYAVMSEPQTSSLSKSPSDSKPPTNRVTRSSGTSSLPLEQKPHTMEGSSSGSKRCCGCRSQSSQCNSELLPDVVYLGRRVTRSSHGSRLSRTSDNPGPTKLLQSPVLSDSVQTRSSSCSLMTDSLSNQEKTSRSSVGVSDWSEIRGDSSAIRDKKDTSDITTYTTSLSCFYNKDDDKSQTNINRAVLNSVKSFPHRSSRNSSQRTSSETSTCSLVIKLERLPTGPSKPKVNIPDGSGLEKPLICTKACTSPASRIALPAERSSVPHTQVKASAASLKTQSCETPSSPINAPTVKVVKRKIFRDLDLDEVFSCRRKKTKRDPNSWQPATFGVVCKQRMPQLSSDNGKKLCFSSSVSMPMTDALLGIIETCLEDNYAMSALDVLTSVTSSKIYPPSRMLHNIMTLLLRDSPTSHQAHRAYNFLMEMLQTHPPRPDEEAIRATYLHSLQPSGIGEYALGQQRYFLNSVIIRLVCSSDDNIENPAHGELLRANSSLLLQYIVAVLESDMASLFQRRAFAHQSSSSWLPLPPYVGMSASSLQMVMGFARALPSFLLPLYKPNESHLIQRDVKSSIVGSIFWPGSQQISIDKHCKDMLDFLKASLDLWRTDNTQVIVAKMLLNIVSMLASCLQIADQTERLPTKILQGEKVSCLVYELARRLSDLPESVLQFVLTALNPPWLGLGVCHLLTEAMDDSLVQGPLCSDEGDLTLSSIVSHDFYLLPAVVGKDSPAKGIHSVVKTDPNLSVCRIKGSIVKSSSGLTSSSASMSSPKMSGSIKRALSKLNRRNAKGETPLHAACARNNVVKVRELLSASGIEVNARDNFGWTPLHEASCNGHLDCVMELVKYRPARTISSYFSKASGQSGERVDLLAANHEGVTALHEAVMYNRLDVAYTLMQHGGQALLKARTNSGDTPLSLCQSEEMRAVLTAGRLEILASPRKLRRANLNLSQGFQDSQNSFTFSQDSFSTPKSDVPTPEMYAALLGEHPSRLHASLEDCLRYVCIVQNKLRLYITCNRLTEAALHGSLSKENIRGDLKVFLGYDTPKKPLKSVSVSPGSFSNSVKIADSYMVEKDVKDVLSRLEEDVNLYMNLRLYLERFRLHIKHISNEADYREMKPKLCAWICLCLF